MVRSGYVAICPICGKKTALRIQDSSYLNEYPIRVNCMNCRALIKGTYIMAETSSFHGLHLDNAAVEIVDGDRKTHLPIGADYIAEISGELPCNLIRENDGRYMDTPFMVAASHLSNVSEMIDRVSHFRADIDTWRKKRMIVFQLLEEGSLDYLPIAISKTDTPIINTHLFQSFQSIQALAVDETQYLYTKDDPKEVIGRMLQVLSTLNQEPVLQFVERVGGTKELIASFRRMMDVVSAFMAIYPNLLPAELFMHYDNKNGVQRGLSTCSYSDIKIFYQDAYESIGSLLHFPVCLDNIIINGDYLKFDELVLNNIQHQNKKKGEKDVFDTYLNQGKGNKYLWLDASKPLQSVFSLPNNSSIRNGIGHNLFNYDPIKQLLVYKEKKNGREKTTELSLMDMAIECCELVKAATIISELILFLLRRSERENNNHFLTHLSLYECVASNDKCPCGSGKKYKRCCWPEVETYKSV